MKGPAVAGGGIVLILAIVVMLMGGDPSALLDQAQQQGAGTGGQTYQPTAEENEQAKFVSVVLADTEAVWTREFQKLGKTYVEPKLVLFTGSVTSACGRAGAAVGPFYCPGDQQIYIDLSFYEQLRRDLGAPGDFAQAYVIAHEVGHHVQNLLGYSDILHSARGRVSQSEYNRLSVRLELQADFLAGVWAHHAQKMFDILEAGDIEEALNAAEKIGDDALQRKSGGAVRPDSFTHGTSAQRARWFRLGLRTGDIRDGDTFDEATWNRVESNGAEAPVTTEDTVVAVRFVQDVKAGTRLTIEMVEPHHIPISQAMKNSDLLRTKSELQRALGDLIARDVEAGHLLVIDDLARNVDHEVRARPVLYRFIRDLAAGERFDSRWVEPIEFPSDEPGDVGDLITDFDMVRNWEGQPLQISIKKGDHLRVSIFVVQLPEDFVE